MNNSQKRMPIALIVLNPVAGVVHEKIIKRLIETRFHDLGWQIHIHITVENENTSKIVKGEAAKDIDLVVAVGGDGTIANVAAGLVHSKVPLGIIPTGTWNAIAHNLQLPFNPIRAINLMTGKHEVRKLDLMAVGNNIHAMNLSMGVSAAMIQQTGREEKRKLGSFAYLSNLARQILGLQLRRYNIEADGVRYRGRATEIFIANYGIIGWNAIEQAFKIKPDDGKVDILIFRARTILDLPSMFWQALILHQQRAPKYRQITAERSINIRTSPPITVQADGELIGQTPVKVSVLPRAVRVIVPIPHPLIALPSIKR